MNNHALRILGVLLAAASAIAAPPTFSQGSEAVPNKYRPFISSLDKVKAVILVPPEHDRGTPADEVDANTVSVAVDVAYHLSKMGIKVLWTNDRLQSEGITRLKSMGADMNFVAHVLTPHAYRNPYIRDYGPFPVMDLETGKWNSVRLDRMKSNHSDESWLGKWLDHNYGIPVVNTMEIKSTRDSGGNAIVDEQGRCFSAGETHPLFKSTIRCSNTVILPCRSEVCHADEYIAPIRNETVVTNKKEFAPILRKAGYKNILMVPYDPAISFANVLIVNDTVFMMYLPRLRKEMQQAKAVYESQGYRVVPVESKTASAANGAMHCLTKEIPAY